VTFVLNLQHFARLRWHGFEVNRTSLSILDFLYHHITSFTDNQELGEKSNDLAKTIVVDNEVKFSRFEITNVSNSVKNYSTSSVTECPYGLVMPDDSSKNIVRIPGNFKAFLQYKRL